MDITTRESERRVSTIERQLQDNERALLALAGKWLTYAHRENDSALESLALAMFEDIRGY